MFTNTEIVKIEEGFTVIIESVVIIPGVVLSVCDGEEAVLSIGGHEVSFAWTEEASALFREIDTCEPIELLAILAQNYHVKTGKLEAIA